jgi:ADP-ribose pyrophosphatase
VTAGEGALADLPAEVVISDRDLLADGFRRYQRLRFRPADAQGPARLNDILRAGPAVVVLPVDVERVEVVLIRQFRLAAHLANGKGDLVEIVAGHVEAGETPVASARRECIEEIGVAPKALIELFSYFTSPGMSDEEVTFFLGVVDSALVPARAGAAAEHEEIAIMRVPIDAALKALASGALRNGPLIAALQWLALNRGRLGQIVRTLSARP